jgi:hypothetical protein
MVGFQLAVTMVLATFAGVFAYVAQSWEVAKLLLTFGTAFGLLGGTLLGWRRGGSAGAGAGASVARGVGGAVAGFFVFANVGLAVGLIVGYFVGGSAMFETIIPVCGTLGGIGGLALGYLIAR